MPAKSKKQQRLFQMALAVRKGDLARNKVWKTVLDIVDSDMTNKEIEDFTVLKEHKIQSLQSFLTEAFTKKDRRDLIKSIHGIMDHLYDEEEGEEIDRDIDEYWFVLKQSKQQYDVLNIKYGFWNEAKDLLQKAGCEFQKLKGDYNQYIIEKVYVKSIDATIKVRITKASIGPKIKTADQETATCIIFNKLIQYYEENQKDIPVLDKGVINGFLVGALNVNFDHNWILSFGEQINTIVKALGGIKNACQYRMERYGGHETYKPEDWCVHESYENMINSYTKYHIGSRKDNWDPTDVILYKKDSANELIKNFNSLVVTDMGNPNSDQCDKIRTYLKSIYRAPIRERIFMGISLKQLKAGSHSFELYNMRLGDRINCKSIQEHPKDSDTNTYRRLRGCYCLIDGKYKFNHKIDDEGEDATWSDHTIKMEMRSFGKGINAIDVTLETGPSIGKCPTHVWSPILGISPDASLDECLDSFSEFINNKLDMEQVNLIVRAAAKNGPNCLPFMLLH